MKTTQRSIAFAMAGVACVALVLGLGMAHVNASGPLGVYGIVEKVVFEPNEKSPERLQVWGVFALVDDESRALAVAPAKRGYLYFKLPTAIRGFSEHSQLEVAKKEWADLKSTAGTGQAIGFGRPPYVLGRLPGGGAQTDLRVRAASEAPASPANYLTNAGIVRLTDRGSNAPIVKQLQEALKRDR